MIIKCIDAIMGAGKSSWAIQYMNEHPKLTFIFVTPYLTEIDRIKRETRNNFLSPENYGEGKLENLKELLTNGHNIVTTHQLFLHIDDEVKELIRMNEYICIMDEELNVIKAYGDILDPAEKQSYNMKPADVRFLLGEGLIAIDGKGKTGTVSWIGPQDYEDFKYSKVRKFAEEGTLICVDGRTLFWMYPKEVFQLFAQVYVLTYQVEGSILFSYFKYHGISVEKFGISGNRESGYSLCRYSSAADEAFRRRCANTVNILDIPQNFSPEEYKKGVLSSSWFDVSTKASRRELKRTFETVRRRKLHSKANELMWTTYQKYEPDISGSGSNWTVRAQWEAERMAGQDMEREKALLDGQPLRRSFEHFLKRYKCFVSLSTRATNAYADRTKLAYLCNIYPNPEIQKFLSTRDARVNEDLYATNMMIQWIWRSAIRRGQEIWIWVPAWRMRGLLRKWLSPEGLTDSVHRSREQLPPETLAARGVLRPNP